MIVHVFFYLQLLNEIVLGADIELFGTDQYQRAWLNAQVMNRVLHA
jgi:hypothetical protein